VKKEPISAKEASSNVIKFPEKKFSMASIEALEQLQEQLKCNKIEFVDTISSELIEELFFKITMMGFDISDDRYAKDSVMIIEAIKSLLLKTMKIDHTMQIASEKLICLSDEEAPEDSD